MSASAILKLQRVGFSVEQVEALADFMDTQAASKADLEATEHRLELAIAEVRADLKAEIAEVRTDLKAEIAGLRSEQKAELAEARSEQKAELAEARSEHKADMIGLNGRLDRLEERIERRSAETEARLIRWMIGVCVAMALTFASAAWTVIRYLPALPPHP
jgi:hypothetical protein